MGKTCRMKTKGAVGMRFEFQREKVCLLSRFFSHSDRRFSMEQEVKLLYAARATRGHRFAGVPTNRRGRDIFLLVLIFG